MMASDEQKEIIPKISMREYKKMKTLVDDTVKEKQRYFSDNFLNKSIKYRNSGNKSIASHVINPQLAEIENISTLSIKVENGNLIKKATCQSNLIFKTTPYM